jgi:hypothetical protein
MTTGSESVDEELTVSNSSATESVRLPRSFPVGQGHGDDVTLLLLHGC